MSFDRSWFWRRWSIFSSLGVCFFVLVYLTVRGEDTRLNQDLANGAFLTIAAIVNGYVFGAAWDTKNKDKAVIAADPNTPTPQ